MMNATTIQKNVLTALLIWVAASTHATHNEAGDTTSTPSARANCSASFQDGCAHDSGGSVTVSGFAAPAGVLGVSLPESGALLLIAGFVAWTLRPWSRSSGKRAARTPPRIS